jgi:hypothetical protein
VSYSKADIGEDYQDAGIFDDFNGGIGFPVSRRGLEAIKAQLDGRLDFIGRSACTVKLFEDDPGWSVQTHPRTYLAQKLNEFRAEMARMASPAAVTRPLNVRWRWIDRDDYPSDGAYYDGPTAIEHIAAQTANAGIVGPDSRNDNWFNAMQEYQTMFRYLTRKLVYTPTEDPAMPYYAATPKPWWWHWTPYTPGSLWPALPIQTPSPGAYYDAPLWLPQLAVGARFYRAVSGGHPDSYGWIGQHTDVVGVELTPYWRTDRPISVRLGAQTEGQHYGWSFTMDVVKAAGIEGITDGAHAGTSWLTLTQANPQPQALCRANTTKYPPADGSPLYLSVRLTCSVQEPLFFQWPLTNGAPNYPDPTVPLPWPSAYAGKPYQTEYDGASAEVYGWLELEYTSADSGDLTRVQVNIPRL